MPENAPPTRSSTLPANVKVLGLASLLNDTASEIVFPLLPTFLISVLGGNRFYLGLIEGLADSIASLLKLWSGGRSDQAGRRKGFILFGYFTTSLARPVIGVITAPWQLLGLRVLDRISKGIRSAPRDALVADSTDPSMRGRAFGFNRAMDHLGATIGPLLAWGFLELWPGEFRPLFALTLLPGILLVLLIVLGLREVPPKEAPRAKLHLTLQPFERKFRLYLLALLVFTLGNSSDAFLLVRAGELGVPVAMLPLLWAAFHILKSAGNWFLGHAVDRFGARPFLFLGWFVYAAVYLAFALATEAWHAWLFFLIYALFYGLTEPAEKTLVTQLAGPERKGLAFGWYNCAIGMGALPASLIFGSLYEMIGPLAAFGFSAGLAAVAAILLALVGPARARAAETAA